MTWKESGLGVHDGCGSFSFFNFYYRRSAFSHRFSLFNLANYVGFHSGWKLDFLG